MTKSIANIGRRSLSFITAGIMAVHPGGSGCRCRGRLSGVSETNAEKGVQPVRVRQ